MGVDAYYVLVHATRGVDRSGVPVDRRVQSRDRPPFRSRAEKAKGLTAVVDHPKLGKLLLFDPTSTLTPFGQLPEYAAGQPRPARDARTAES